MILETQDLTKSYGDLLALDCFTVRFQPGIYALLGPNGAGKSTLIKLLSMNLVPDRGNIFCDRVPVEVLKEKYRKRIGYVPQQQRMPDRLKAAEFLSFIAALKGMKKQKIYPEITRLLTAVGLQEKQNEKIGSFSGGMKQRLLIAQALLDDPDFLILDEPTAGLDPKERIRIRNILSREAADKIMLYATHVVSDIEGIADQVILLEKGKILAVNTPEELLSRLEGKVFEAMVSKDDLEKIRKHFLVSQIRSFADGYLVRIVTRRMLSEKYPAKPVSPSLEDVYLYYFGQEEELQ